MHLTEQSTEAKGSLVASNDLDVAGAPASCKLGNEPKAAALRFGSRDNVRNSISYNPEYSDRLMILKNINVPESYKKGKLKIVFKFNAYRKAGEFDLVFLDVKHSVGGDERIFVGNCQHSAADYVCHYGDGNERCMCCVSELVQSPDEVIPSFVRLEAPKERHDFIRDVFTNFATSDAIFQPSKVVSDRECGLFRIRISSRNRSGKPCLVKSGAQRFNGFSSGVDTVFRQLPNESEFVNLCRSIRVFFGDNAVWFFFEEFFYSFVKSFDVLLCSI